MFYIIGFTLALGWISSSYRDRPWLLVLGSTVVLMGSILAVLYALQWFNMYDGWDVLFTGGFYFSKNKIFGTIGEAQAPSRGVLFASYGPIVSLIAIFVSVMLLWRALGKKNKAIFFLDYGLSLLFTWLGLQGVSYSTQHLQFQLWVV